MMSNRLKRLSLLVLAILLLCTGCQSAPGEDGADDTPVPPAADDSTDWMDTVVIDGVTYRRRTDLKTILFLGIDDAQTVKAEGGVVGNNGRSDTMILFILDEGNKTVRPLTISRNSMTEVDVYKGNGDLAYSGQMQINMQYSFGNSAVRSCFLTKRTVSELLYDTPIDGYLAMTMAGISVIVDELGGVTLVMPEDYTEIDKRYTEGAKVTLTGADAERFVRYRDITVAGSNETRADRQSWFIYSLFQQMRAKGNMADSVEHLLAAVDDYVETDLDAETMKMLVNCTLLDESLKVPGTTVEGELYDEYHVDEEALQALLIQLFYEPVE